MKVGIMQFQESIVRGRERAQTDEWTLHIHDYLLSDHLVEHGRPFREVVAASARRRVKLKPSGARLLAKAATKTSVSCSFRSCYVGRCSPRAVHYTWSNPPP